MKTTITSISGEAIFNMTSLLRHCKVTPERNKRISIYGRALIDGVEYLIQSNAYNEDRTIGIYTLGGVRVGNITSYYDESDKERLSINFDESTCKATIYKTKEAQVKGEYKATLVDDCKKQADALLTSIDGNWYSLTLNTNLDVKASKSVKIYSEKNIAVTEKMYNKLVSEYNIMTDF